MFRQQIPKANKDPSQSCCAALLLHSLVLPPFCRAVPLLRFCFTVLLRSGSASRSRAALRFCFVVLLRCGSASQSCCVAVLLHSRAARRFCLAVLLRCAYASQVLQHRGSGSQSCCAAVLLYSLAALRFCSMVLPPLLSSGLTAADLEFGDNSAATKLGLDCSQTRAWSLPNSGLLFDRVPQSEFWGSGAGCPRQAQKNLSF